MSARGAIVVVLVTVAVSTGCVHRTIMITSEPAGALVWLNDREIGRTPLEVGFEYYGTYDVRLERQGFEPVMTSGSANPPWWETLGLDLLAELVPLELRSEIQWHYDLRPADPEGLLERARELRSRAQEPDP